MSCDEEYPFMEPDSYARSPSTDTMELRNKKLFDASEYNEIESDREKSLQLLSNSVYIATCTILHERRLIPEKAFIDFNVYGDAKGYIMDENDKYGKMVAKKFGQISSAIIDRMLKKFALVVDDEANNVHMEVFIWNFKYDKPGEAVAEFGIRGKKQKFTLKYSDMDETCKQFCNLYSNLRKILNELSPLSTGLTPSFRLAFLGEPDPFPGFFAVDKFVDMEQISIGKVRYPREELHLTYASNYAPLEETMAYQSTLDQELDNIPMETDLASGSPVFEETRWDSNQSQVDVPENMVDEGFADLDPASGESQSDVSEGSPAQYAELLNLPTDNGISELCQPNIISQEELHNDSAETVIVSQESNIYSQLTVSPEQPQVPLKPASSDVTDVYELTDEPISTKRASRRLTFSIPPAVEIPPDSPPKSKKKPARKGRKVAPKHKSVDTKNKEKQRSRTFGRVASIKSLIWEENPKTPRIYGRVPSLCSLSEVSEDGGKKATRFGISANINIS